MKNRIKLLAKWLNNADTSTFYYDSYHSGKLESAIANAQVEVCNKIGDMLEEILQMYEKQLQDNLEEQQIFRIFMYMNKEIVQQIINEVYPKIVKHYGEHKGYKIPKVEIHNSIFDRLALIPVSNDGIMKMQGVDYPSGEFCKEPDKIFIYFPEI